MEIFGIGPFELALIVLIAFIVLGPERIPGVMRQLGRGIRQLREMSQQLTRDYGGELDELTGAVNEVQTELRSIQRDLNQAARGMFIPPNESSIGGQAKPPSTPPPPPPPAVEPPEPKTDETSSENVDYSAGI